MPKPYQPNDKWSQRAAAEGYRARSVYKLKELDERFGLLKPGMTVLDLGAAPGSWLQFASEKIQKPETRNQNGLLLGIDLQEIEPIEGVITHQADITDTKVIDSILAEAGVEKVDLILSDLAPSTSGVKDIDQWRSVELSQAVLAVAARWLAPGGTCVMKVLQGADFDEFLHAVKQDWRDVKLAHVEASRDRSREVYLVARGKNAVYSGP